MLVTNCVTARARSMPLNGARAALTSLALLVCAGCGAPEVLEPRSHAPASVEEPPTPERADAHRAEQEVAPPQVLRADELVLPIAETRDAATLSAWSESGTEPPTLRLTLRPCLLEPFERWDGAASCAPLGAGGPQARSQRALRVPAGRLVLAVDNQTDGEGGLWVRRDGDPSQTVLSAGGARRDGLTAYTLELSPGTYHVSCPLTPTPDYVLIAEAP